MSKYQYETEPIRIDLVDDARYDESELDAMHPDVVYEIARDLIVDHDVFVRRV